MKVSVIIINYNTRQLTSDCIQSVIKYTAGCTYEIILVDNASSECDPEIFSAQFPSIKLIKSTINGGFAYGNNLGIEQAVGEYILLLNSDTILQEDSIGKSVAAMEMHPEAGVLGCRMVFPDGKIQYTARRFRSISWELLDLFRFIPMLMPYKRRSRKMLGKYFSHDEPVFCDWLNGAFFLFPRKVLKELPGKKLDDRFFMYGEDQLWCEQISQLGYSCLFFPGTTIIHINSGSTDIAKQIRLRKTMMKHELKIMQLRKGKGLYYYIFKMIFTVKESTRNFIKSIIFRLTGRLMK
ncbi:MAG TPA: glycosyltransferase family 2 protein [Chitinophagaceae bacterium]|nr:glycosyltransferase family 2 protein [Chitinophagaceae bacterium]